MEDNISGELLAKLLEQRVHFVCCGSLKRFSRSWTLSLYELKKWDLFCLRACGAGVAWSAV